MGSLAFWLSRGSGERPDVIFYTVKKEVLHVSVSEKGQVESAANKDIICRVRAGNKGYASTINEVIADGTRVKPGELLMVLDDSALKDQEDNQRIVVKQAEAAAFKAEKDYRIVKEETEGLIATAEDTVQNTLIDLEKYTGIAVSHAKIPLAAIAGIPAALEETGAFRQELDDLNGQISLAQANVEQNRERSDWAQRMVKQSYMSAAQAQSEKSRFDSSVEDLRSKQAKRDQLIKYDRRKMLTTYRGAHEDAVRKLSQAKLNAEAKQATAKTEWETSMDLLAQQREKLTDIIKQRELCTIKAPFDIKPDSMVVYFKNDSGRFSNNQVLIEQGQQVKEGQKMLRIPNLEKMQVITKVHEAMVSRIKIGQRALVETSEKQFVGTVAWVSSVASQTDSFMSDVKLYPTIVRIEGELGADGKVVPLSGEVLKPDMSAQVSISVEAGAHPYPTIPLQSVIGGAEMGATREIFVKAGNGVERRSVVLGLYNDKMVEVRTGLTEGEEVVTNPKVLLGDKEKTKTRDAGDGKQSERETEKSGDKGPGSAGGDPSKGPQGGPGGGDPSKGGPRGSKGQGPSGDYPKGGASGDYPKGPKGPKGGKGGSGEGLPGGN